MQQTEEKALPLSFALFELGFRPFFSAAALFAVLAVGLWTAILVLPLPWAPQRLDAVLWHGHEMLFGYAMAVIAGFLLTAVGNWTGVAGLRGAGLITLLAAWIIARAAFLWSTDLSLLVAALADTVFAIGLIVAVATPILRVRQWRQLGILAKLVLLLVSNMAFYAGVWGYLPQGTSWGVYSGLYLVLGLIFAMARRVLPFFIEQGVGEAFKPRNRLWVDVSSMVLFLAWAVLDVFFEQRMWVAVLSVALFLLHLVRMRDWFTPGILASPLLWSLYLGYGFLLLGFLLKALAFWFGVPPTLSVHAFAVGGIGMITLGMMARVSLGHTGRDVLDPPKTLAPMFSFLVAGTLARVIAPLVDQDRYLSWLALSQTFWILAFTLFLIVYLPMLVRPRLDGRAG